MRRHGTHAELYVHLVWTTRERLPLFVKALRQPVFACILAECRELCVEVLALNAMEDHVHLLVCFPTSVPIAVVAKQAKGASSHLVTHPLGHDAFSWQEGYGAFTVARWDVPKLVEYIERQEEHHLAQTTKTALEPA